MWGSVLQRGPGNWPYMPRNGRIILHLQIVIWNIVPLRENGNGCTAKIYFSSLSGPLLFREDNRGGYEALSDAMMAYVAQFARTGTPDVDGLPEWTEWSNTDGESKRILFDANANEAVIEMSTK